MFPYTIDGFLEGFSNINLPDLKQGAEIELIRDSKENDQKYIPVIRLATSDDAREITEVFKEAYSGTYPFKELEDVENVAKLIDEQKIAFNIGRDSDNTLVGFFMVRLELEQKRGYIGGLAIRNKYKGRLDLFKVAILSFLSLFRSFKGLVTRWYGETRTAHSKAQYLTSLIGARIIAYLPNKDIMQHKVESELMHITYDREALANRKSRNPPKIIEEVLNCFLYSNRRYNLGPIEIVSPNLSFDNKKTKEYQTKIEVKKDIQNFGYEIISFHIQKSKSYFSFLYTPQLQNIEKVDYKIDNLEELTAFLLYLKDFMKIHSIRYFECYISSHKPNEQFVFYKMGFQPRGYISAWNYIENEGRYEDCIVFNYFTGEINKSAQIIPDGVELLKTLKT